MKSYEMLGRPNVPVPLLTDRRVGDVFDADIDADLEQQLLDAGALKVVNEEVPADATESEPGPEPEPEPEQPAEQSAEPAAGPDAGWPSAAEPVVASE
jgi:hypothetical protein